MSRITLKSGDCLKLMQSLQDDSVNLTFCSPPYEAARSYGIDFTLQGDEWVAWAAERFMECLRVTNGLVAWVVEGRTRKHRYSATPILLMAELHKRGVILRKPPIYHRSGIPGSGGKDWLRNDYEFIVCGSRRQGQLPWSDNTAMGGPPKYAPGGNPSHHARNGRVKSREYAPPTKANPGNVITCKVGGGHIGDKLAHENEAPFPERLAEFFIRSFCPPDGIVLDCFCGSGTTNAVAERLGRRSIGYDIRESQIAITNKRFINTLFE